MNGKNNGFGVAGGGGNSVTLQQPISDTCIKSSLVMR
jgi:hypothetical protein